MKLQFVTIRYYLRSLLTCCLLYDGVFPSIREFVQRDVDVVVARGQSVVKFLTFVVTFSLVLPN